MNWSDTIGARMLAIRLVTRLPLPMPLLRRFKPGLTWAGEKALYVDPQGVLWESSDYLLWRMK